MRTRPPELLRIFAREAQGYRAGLAAFEPTPAALEPSSPLWDLLHNLKGSLAMMGQNDLAAAVAAHAASMKAHHAKEGEQGDWQGDKKALLFLLDTVLSALERDDWEALDALKDEQRRAPVVAHEPVPPERPDDLAQSLSRLFLDEAHEHLSAIREALAESAGGGDNPGASSRLFRHLLNLQGAASMAHQSELSRLASLLIALLEGAEAKAYALNGPTCRALFMRGIEQGFLWLDAIHLGQNPQAEPELARLAKELALLRPELSPRSFAPEKPEGRGGARPAKETTDDLLARELRDIFQAEGAEHLAALSRLILSIEKEGPAPELIDSLFRTVHTLKGAASTVGMKPLAEAAHQLETQIERWRGDEGPPDTSLLSLLYMGERTLRALLDQGPAAPAYAAESFAALPSALAKLNDGEIARLLPIAAQEAGGEADRSLRVKMNRLDHLMNLVSALYVHRSHLEDLTASFGRLSKKIKWERKTRGKLVDGFIRHHQYERPQAPQSAEPIVGGAALAEFSELQFDRYSDVAVFARTLEESEFRLSGLLKRIEAEMARFTEEGLAFNALVASLREEMTALRMVPIEQLFERVTFQAQNLARQLDKKVRVVTEGGATEVDKALVDGLGDALMHLLRNALDHGVESPAERRARGKPETGTIRLTAEAQARHVVITLADDGAGVDVERVTQAAIKSGLLTAKEAERRSPEDRLALIFQPSVSTSQVLSEISGRGVGLDAVRHQVAALYGSIRVASEAGKGSSFILSLPFTMAMQPMLGVAADEYKLNLPMAYVEAILDTGDLQHGEDELSAVYKNEVLQKRHLARYLRLPQEGMPSASPAIVLHVAERRMALVVDAVFGREESIVRPMPVLLGKQTPFLGTTLTPDGDIRLVLNVPLLFDQADNRALHEAAGPNERPAVKVLIADDSLSVRQMLKKMLTRHGIKANTAQDGLIAWQKMHGLSPDAMIVDLEMPGLNGFELIERIRRHPDFSELPTVVVTSRAGEKHMERAYAAGADAFLTKPVLERELLATLRDILPKARRDILDAYDQSRERGEG